MRKKDIPDGYFAWIKHCVCMLEKIIYHDNVPFA